MAIYNIKTTMHKALAFLFFTNTFVFSTACADFNDLPITANWEIWSGKTPAAGGETLGVLDSELIYGNNDTAPDFSAFHSSTGNDYELWDIDFNGKQITLTYSSIAQQTFDHQYMYMSAVGFHFEDTQNLLGEITNVTVFNEFAPFGFNPRLTRFDENNIWVDLQGSMCHTTAMGSMPTCTNPQSPTGYDNQIIIMVDMVEKEQAPLDYDRVERLMDWAQANYPIYFPSAQQSFDYAGYYVRHYPETNNYLGTDGVDLYVYGDAFGGLLNLGNLENWLNDLGF